MTRQIHSLGDYLIPGETTTPLIARVRAYTALALGDEASAEYLIERGVQRADRATVVEIGREMANAPCTGCGLPRGAHTTEALTACEVVS